MIVEVRTYKIKPGQRQRFLDFFARDAVPLQRAKGMRILGPLVDLEDPDVFVWLRAFPSLEERERMKRALYEGEEWKNELEAIAMPMLESYSVALTTAPPGFVDDLAETCTVASTSHRDMGGGAALAARSRSAVPRTQHQS